MPLGDGELAYSATVGMMPLKDEQGEILAQIFYTAYTLDGDDRAARPADFRLQRRSRLRLHLAAHGRAGTPNASTWARRDSCRRRPSSLSTTLTPGWTWATWSSSTRSAPATRAPADPDDNKKYWGLAADLEAVGEFIRLYLSRSQRWTSPLYLAGESYGTDARGRAWPGISSTAASAFNGILLLSTVMNFQTLRFTKGNDLPYHLYLPSYCATAWYHKALSDEMQARALPELLEEVMRWSEEVYTVALAKGDRIAGEEREALAAQLSRVYGLVAAFHPGRGFAHQHHELLQGTAARRQASRRAAGFALCRHYGFCRGAELRLRPVHARHRPALYGCIQSICPRAAGLRKRPELRNPGASR